MSKSILVAAVATIMPAAQAEIMNGYFNSDVHPMLVVRNKLTDFHHILYLQDNEVKSFNVGGAQDFTALAQSAYAAIPNKTYDTDYALKNWASIIKESDDALCAYLLSVIEEHDTQNA